MAVSALLSRIYGKDFSTLQQINSTRLNSTNAAYSLRISLLQRFSSAMPGSKSTVFRANSYRNHKRSLKIKFFNIVYCFHNTWRIIKPFFLVLNLKMLTFQKQYQRKQNRVDKWKWSIWCEFPIKSHCVKSVQIRSFSWSAFSRIRTERGEILWMRKNTTRKNSVFGHFSCRVSTGRELWEGVQLTLPPHISSVKLRSRSCYITGQRGGEFRIK